MPMQPGQGWLHLGRRSPACYHLIKGCECPWCVEARASKRREHDTIRAARGPKPTDLVGPEKFAQARERVAYWHDVCGLSFEQISGLVGLHGSALVMRIVGSGVRANADMRRATYERVMALPRVPAEPDIGLVRRGGAWTPAVGAQRRLQALMVRGFNGRALGRIMEDMTGRRLPGGYLSAMASGYTNGSGVRVKITRGMHDDINALFQKLADQDPDKWGVHQSQACIKRAVAKGWAPPACWDDDTIDDPAAIPDWTGECGTLTGYYRHLRKGGTPPCQPCKDARKGER